MKRSALLRHLRTHGCVLKREGRSHSLWMNPASGAVEAVPRHTEIPDLLARRSAAGSESLAGSEWRWLTPPRPLEEIEADIRGIESDILRMLSEVTGTAGV